MDDQAPYEPKTTYVTVSPAVSATAGGAILTCVVLLLVLSLRDTPGSPHGASLALIVGGGLVSALASFSLARRGRRSLSQMTGHDTGMDGEPSRR